MALPFASHDGCTDNVTGASAVLSAKSPSIDERQSVGVRPRGRPFPRAVEPNCAEPIFVFEGELHSGAIGLDLTFRTLQIELHDFGDA
jgi:hypothetical protein